MTMNITQIPLFDVGQTVTRPYEVCILEVATRLAAWLWSGQQVQHQQVRTWMTRAFGGSDTNGVWNWKDVYEAQECALVFLLQQHASLFREAPEQVIARLAQLEYLPLTQTVRSEESVRFQQFSTPPQLAYLASLCANMTLGDTVIEPEAGTGIMAQFIKLKTANLILNELNERRASLLKRLFPKHQIYIENAEQLNDRLPDEIHPTVIVMNPPFSATPHVDRRNPYATVNHIRSSFQRLVTGGRLVVISGSWFCPSCSTWETGLGGLQDFQVRWTAEVKGNAYYKHGTTCDTRITVIDKIPTADPEIVTELVMSRTAFTLGKEATWLPTFSTQELDKLKTIPPRAIVQPKSQSVATTTSIRLPIDRASQLTRPTKQPLHSTTIAFHRENIQPVAYRVLKTPYQCQEAGGLYAVYRPQRIEIAHAKPHPSIVCEAIALNTVLPPVPTYKPMLPAAVVEQGLLSDVQIESVIYAGQAHSRYLGGHYKVGENWEKIEATSPNTLGAVRFRTGWCNGNGTGSGKGREICGVILDNFCQGRTKAVWVSRSDKLLKDARRDWCALGGQESDVFPLSQSKLGNSILREQGILFVSYATLRSVSKTGKPSRLQQIVEWLGPDFAGVVAFDEAHALKNATANDEDSEDNSGPASLQGRAGLKLQRAVPDARVLYVSATGATNVANLGYAERLGLWGTGDFPFASQSDFIQAIEQGGVAAMEMVCRDLKALGLYHAHNLSFEGVEYEPLEVKLSSQQVEIYDTYAEAFQLIHQSLEKALKICKISNAKGKTLNKTAKRSAMSLFESTKQRFFNHLLSSMKCPTLIQSIEQDLDRGEACVVQLVSTCEELMERRLAEIPAGQWNNLSIDITPREYVMHYLSNAFPMQLFEEFSTEDDKVESRPVLTLEGDPVLCKEAVEQRNALIETLAHLPPLASALDQLLHTFGEENIAEVTGRSRRILCDREAGRLYVSSRPASSNVCEVQAFMEDHKRILVFSDAGSTGESYHAAATAKNNRKRNHYVLEAGWIADRAVQSLGRTHRTDQRCAPLFRLITTNVRGERRFISTIARRLDSLGALTKGQRQTGGQNLFDPRDNLESTYAAAALRWFFYRLSEGQIKGQSLAQFEQYSGLKLRTEEGRLKDDLPKMSTFLNRILALPVALQNSLFAAFEKLLDMVVESAKANGTFEVGVEMIRADHLHVQSRQQVYSHPIGGTTTCVEIEQLERNRVLTVEEALELRGELLFNERSHRAAVSLPTTSTLTKDGATVSRRELVHPAQRIRIAETELRASFWKPVSIDRWQAAWQNEVDAQPEFISSRFFLLCGLLLPIWNHLKRASPRVFRLVTDEDEKLMGRFVEVNEMPKLVQSLGLNQVKLTASEVYKLVMEEKQSIKVANLILVKVTIMQDYRIEIVGAISQALGEQLKKAGCFTEIIAWKARYFIPSEELNALPVIDRVRQLMDPTSLPDR